MKLRIFKRHKNTEEDFDIRKDAFMLVIHLMMGYSLVAFVMNLIFGAESMVIPVALIISYFVSVGLLFVYRKTRNYEVLSLFMMLYILGFMMNIFQVYGSQGRGATPIWFGALAIALFFMIDFKKYWWCVFLLLYLDLFVFVKHYLWNTSEARTETPLVYFTNVLLNFALMSLAIVTIVLLQERSLKKERAAIEESREIVKNAGAAKSRFLANMSHEIRTPMNSIIGLSEIILKDEMDDATRQEVVTIKDSAYDLLDIIDNVLAFAKLDSGKMNLVRVDIKMADFIKSILDTLAIPIQDKNLLMRIRLDHDIPATVRGDDIKIRQIITRLAFISLQLTDNGRIMLDLTGQMDADQRRVHFTGSISDTGVGLNQVDLDAIYGAYDTYDSRQNSNLKGIGLKFAICREMLEMMGGTLEVTSIDGVGLNSDFDFYCDVVDPSPMITLESDQPRKVLIYPGDGRELDGWKQIMEGFEVRPDYVNSYFSFDKAIQNKKYDYIFLPGELYPSVSNILSQYKIEESVYVVGSVKQAYGDFDKCRIIRHPVTCITIADVLNGKWNQEDYLNKSEEEVYDGSKAKILVVDDNSVNLKVASGVFRHYKIDIDQAKSGEECLRKMENIHYDIVFMDMIMPEMTGPETLKKIRAREEENFKNVPVVALTATTEGNIRDEVLDMGFQEYLAKPIKQRYLLNILKAFLPPSVFKVGKPETKKEEKKEEDLTKLENVLVTSKGIANIGYNEDSYCAILNTYYSEGMRKIKELPDLLEAGDISLFTTNVHGIKSSSASIGAMTVSAMFKELEFAGKDNNTDKIHKYYDAYVEALKKILEDVKNYLTSKGKFEYVEEPEHADLSSEDEENLTPEMLEELKTNIDKMNLKECDRLVDDYSKRNFGAAKNEQILKIKKAYEMFDFHGVKQVLSEMLGN